MPASRISVEVAGTSVSLQAAVVKAAESLTGLGDVLARQTDLALAEGDKTVRMNELVAKSYGAAAAQAGVASDRTIAAFERQGAVALDSAKLQERASEQAALAAKASAEVQVKASAATGAASLGAAAKHEQAAKRSEAAFGSSSSSLSKAGKTITLGLLGAAAASVDLAVKFQSNTLRLQTQAGAAASQLEKLRAGILGMAQAVGFTPNQLADGMYHVVSSMNAVLPPTQRVAVELKVLRGAAEGARVGHSSLEETTYALASAMNALHTPGQDATKVMGQLNAIVGAGDMTMTDLIDSFKSGLVPGARVAGVSLQSLGAALAVMGDQGMRGALAGTRLRMSIALLSSPSAAAAKVLDTLGLSSKQATSTSQAMALALEKAGLRTTTLSADLRKPDGIMVALRDLNQHLRDSGLTATGAAAVMDKAFGGGRMGATITLLAQSTDRLDTKFHQIGRSAGQFGHDWQLASHTTAGELHSLEGGLLSLGTSIGTDLLPALNTVVGDTSDVVHWFEKGSTAAHALELTIGTLATVAIGSYLVSRLGAAIKLMREFGQVARDPVGSLGTFFKSTAPAAPGGGAGLAGAALSSFSGARGPELIGSLANPMIVAIEAGQFAGLSSMGAAGTVATEQKVAAAETGAISAAGAGAVPVATGVAASEGAAAATGASAAEGAVAGSLATTIKSGLSDLVGGLMKGGIIAGVGTIGSQLLGGAIGGKTGKTVAGFGTAASIGAGAGTVILGPGAGTAIGAAVGAAIEGLHLLGHTPTVGEVAAGSLSKGFGGQPLRTELAQALNDAQKIKTTPQPAELLAMARILDLGRPGGTADAPGSAGPFASVAPKAPVPALTAAQRAKMLADYQTAGLDVAKALEMGWGQYKFQSEPAMLTQFLTETRKLPPQAQAAAAEAAVAFAQTLQKEGKLPAGSAKAMLFQIEQQFPGLTAYMGQSAASAVAAFHANFDLHQTERDLNTALSKMRGDFPQVVQAMDQTKGDIQQKSVAVIAALRGIVANGTGPMKAQAQRDLSGLQSINAREFTSIAADAAAKIGDVRASVSGGYQQAVNNAADALSAYSQNVHNAMNSGALSAGQGMQAIVDATNKVLGALGGQKLSSVQIKGLAALQSNVTSYFAAHPPAAVPSTPIQTSGGGAGVASLLAAGGYIGSPGQKGQDGVLAMLGPGEAVLKHQDQAIVNRALSGTPYGSLDGVFAATAGRKHWMAAGGYAGYSLPLPRAQMMPGSWSVDQGVDIPAGAGTPEFAIGPGVIIGEGISGFGPNAPILRITKGPLAGAEIYYGHAGPDLVKVGQAVSAGEQISEVGSGIVGISTGPHIEIGYYPPGAMGAGSRMAITLQQLLGGAGVTGVGGAASKITAPQVSGAGAIAEVVRAALGRAAKAATSYLGSKRTALGSAGVAGSTAAGVVPGIMAIEQQAARIAGIPFNAQVVRALLGHESYGGENLPPTGPLHATGPNQVIPSTFTRYALPGYTNIGVPLDNAIASWRYVLARYGSMEAMAAATGLYGSGYVGYAGGGYTGAHAASVRIKPPKLPKAPKAPKGEKPGQHVGAPHTRNLTPAQLQILDQANAAMGALQTKAQTLTGQYSAQQGRFSAVEGGEAYLNADGTMNAAGIALHKADDQQLISIDQQLLGVYGQELSLIAPALKGVLGNRAADTRKISTDTLKVAANKKRIANWRTEILDLQKPTPDATKTIKAQIHTVADKITSTRSHYTQLLAGVGQGATPQERGQLAALRTELAVLPSGKATSVRRHELAAQIAQITGKISTDTATKAAQRSAIRTEETGELADLTAQKLSLGDALSAEERKIHDAKFKLSTKEHALRLKINALEGTDSSLSSTITAYRGALKGDNPVVAALESIASSLGVVNFDGQGNFTGIDSSGQGLIYTTNTDILNLQNDVAQTGLAGSGAAGATADNTQLVALLQMQNLQLSEALALNEAQTSVLQGMLPLIPHYAQGGPVLDDGLIYAHKGEHVVPSGGQLVMGGGGDQTVELHQHYHGRAGELMRFIDSRIQHPDNIRVISRTIGNRTSMLRGAPGSR